MIGRFWKIKYIYFETFDKKCLICFFSSIGIVFLIQFLNIFIQGVIKNNVFYSLKKQKKNIFNLNSFFHSIINH